MHIHDPWTHPDDVSSGNSSMYEYSAPRQGASSKYFGRQLVTCAATVTRPVKNIEKPRGLCPAQKLDLIKAHDHSLAFARAAAVTTAIPDRRPAAGAPSQDW